MPLPFAALVLSTLPALPLLPLLPGGAPQFGRWHAIGPFDHPAGARDVATPQPPERSLKRQAAGREGPDLAGESARGRAGNVRWRPVEVDPARAGALDVGSIDLARELAPKEPLPGWADHAAAYLYRRIDAEEPAELDLGVGSDDGLRLWCNGELVIDHPGARSQSVEDDHLRLKLVRGANHLLAKVVNENGAWSFRIAAWKSTPQSAVDAAIERGVRYLLDAQLLDGGWGFEESWGPGHPAFAVYALIECGVPANDPALRLARRLCEARTATTTYAHASLVLAACASGAGKEDALLARSLAALFDVQASSGRFGYPVKPDGYVLAPDLSNSVFAALAFRAASKRGLAVPDKTWSSLAEGALGCLAKADEDEAAAAAKERRPVPAGFGYVPGDRPTGSMTCAGLSILALCEEALGSRASPALRKRIAAAREPALAWLGRRIAWTRNPEGAHQYFWIYGVERAGTLVGEERIGGVEWYPAGATWLVAAQRPNGSWAEGGDARREPLDTLLALLFLRRATRPVSLDLARGRADPGPKTAEREGSAAEHHSDARSGDLVLRARGQAPVGFSIVEVRADLVRTLAQADGRLAIESIELVAREVGGTAAAAKPIATGAGGTITPQELAAREWTHTFEHPGLWGITARVRLAGSKRELVSAELVLRVTGVFDERRLEYAADPARNLLREAGAVARASSSASGAEAVLALDSSYASSWRCAATDRTPSIAISLERPVQAGRLLLAHARPSASGAREPRAISVEVVVNRTQRYPLELDPDVLLKSVLALSAAPVRELEIRVTSAEPGLGAGELGFSEIELLR